MSQAPNSTTDYERLGGEEGLRRIVAELIETIANDTIIAFFLESIIINGRDCRD